MPDSDAAPARRARGGDRDAFATLVRRHRPLLLRSCRRLVGDDGAADAAQDAVLTAMLSPDRLRRAAAFGPWLVGIGLNAGRAMLRQRRETVTELHNPEGGLSPLEVAESRYTSGLVREAIAALPRGQREAVALYYLAGLTQAEAAAHLGIPPGAVKTRLHKARASLRARLQPDAKETPMVRMEVADVRRAGDKHILMLAGDGRELKIWVGQPEAASIAVLVENVEF